jgi:prophage antirepressor-like protein
MNMNIRVAEIDGEPWFIAKDVCDTLDIETTNVRRSPDTDEIKSLKLSGLPGRPPLVVSESGLYALVMRSTKPEAKAFRKWVTSVVLPAIRRDDAYIRGEEHAKSDDGRCGTARGEIPSRGTESHFTNFSGKNLRNCLRHREQLTSGVR